MKTLVIKFLRIGLDLLKADPADKAQITDLQAQVAAAKAEIATLQEKAFTEEEESEVNSILAEFEAATVPAAQ